MSKPHTHGLHIIPTGNLMVLQGSLGFGRSWILQTCGSFQKLTLNWGYQKGLGLWKFQNKEVCSILGLLCMGNPNTAQQLTSYPRYPGMPAALQLTTSPAPQLGFEGTGPFSW